MIELSSAETGAILPVDESSVFIRNLVNFHAATGAPTDSPRQSRATALARNRYVATIAQQIVLAGVNEASSLYCFYEDYKDKIANLPTF